MAIHKTDSRNGRARTKPRSAERRQAHEAPNKTVAGIPIEEIGPRIVANAQCELADIIREQYWRAKGESVWRRVCRNSLKARCANTWVEVVRRLGRA